VFRFPALRRHEAHKTESQALTKTNDGKLSILDAMENLVKAVALRTLRHALRSNHFGPPLATALNS
jgi:hypothetical protein